MTGRPLNSAGSSSADTDWGMPEFYRYSPLPTSNSIRSFELLPGLRNSPIRIKLRTISLDDKTTYECLSYEWNLPISKEKFDYRDFPHTLTMALYCQQLIVCDDKVMPIMENLKAALEHLRYAFRSRVLWADAICINQNDVGERGQQVLLMSRIYEQATKVLLWIGDEKDNTQKIFHLAPRLARAYTEMEMRYAGQAKKELTIDPGTYDQLKAHWSSVTDIFTRSVFGRVWVVQEIVLARRLDVICGRHQLPWSDFLAAAKCIMATGLLDGPWYTAPTTWFWRRLKSLGEVHGSRHRESRRGNFPLHILGTLFLGHNVTDPRDRIYGMLSLVVPQSSYGRTNPISPDYNKSVASVYQHATEWSFIDSNSLAMLDLCDAPATSPARGMFPTWVADLGKGPQKCPLPAFNRLRIPRLGSLLSLFQGDFHVSFDGRILRAAGLVFDTVSLARSPCTETGKHVVMMEQFHLFCLDQQPYPTGGSKLDALWRTFLTNYVDLRNTLGCFKIPRREFGDHFAHAMSREILTQLGLPEHLTGQMPDLRDMADPNTFFNLYNLCPGDVESNLSILALRAKHPFIELLYDSLRNGDGQAWVDQVRTRHFICHGDEGRQFFVTAKGLMGFGPPCPPVQINDYGNVMLPTGSGVRRGDSVAVLAGSDYVWILRGDPRGGYVIVGNSYVYGLSEGLCFTGDIPAKMETLVIH